MHIKKIKRLKLDLFTIINNISPFTKNALLVDSNLTLLITILFFFSLCLNYEHYVF